MCAFPYRTSVHATTKFTLFYLMYGREAVLQTECKGEGDLLFSITGIECKAQQYAANLEGVRTEIFTEVTSNIQNCSSYKQKLYGTVHEKIAPLIYYKNVIKMHHVCIAITSQRLTLSTSYFHHFIPHHFSTVKCILESWTISVPTFLRAIPPGVQNYHIFV